jgi:hypothetical protein
MPRRNEKQTKKSKKSFLFKKIDWLLYFKNAFSDYVIKSLSKQLNDSMQLKLRRRL